MDELTLRQARDLLAAWGGEHAARDDLIRAGVLAGLGKSEVARLMGLSRWTVDAVLKQELTLNHDPITEN